MSSRRITYIISGINRSVALESSIAAVAAAGYTINVILLNKSQSPFEDQLRKTGIRVSLVRYERKRHLIPAFFSLLLLLTTRRPRVVHCHLFEASILGLLVSRLLFIPVRIYTRHHSDFHWKQFPRAVKYDRWCNGWSTRIVAVSPLVKNILTEWEGVNENKITVIRHGFQTEMIRNVPAARVEALRKKYNIQPEDRVVGVISRYIEWKGVQFIIDAFPTILRAVPNAKLVLANAAGDLEKLIKKKLSGLPEGSFMEIKFEEDVYALFHCFEVFVHVPLEESNESFGQVYIEAVAAGIPSVLTISGIAPEVIRHQENAIVIPASDAESIAKEVTRILQDEQLRNRLKEGCRATDLGAFSLERMTRSLVSLYGEP